MHPIPGLGEVHYVFWGELIINRDFEVRTGRSYFGKSVLGGSVVFGVHIFSVFWYPNSDPPSL